MELEIKFFKDGPERMSVSEAAGSIMDALRNHSILMGLEDSLSDAGGLDGVQISLSSKPKPTVETASTSAPVRPDIDPANSTTMATDTPDEMSATPRTFARLISMFVTIISCFRYQP